MAKKNYHPKGNMLEVVLFFILLLLSPTVIYAVCPLCTFAVGAGVGLTQYFGIDDTIIGLWMGALVISLIVWTKDWFKNRNIKFFASTVLITLFYYSSVILPLYIKGIIGSDLNKIWGVDKIIFGIALGSISFYIGSFLYVILKKNNGNKAYFPFQKVVMPVLILVILTIVFYYLTG